MNDAGPVMTERCWPIEEIEEVRRCPICTSPDRTLVHEALSDRVFFVAPGEWNVWECASCRTAYLDPRPTQSSIARAYEVYYTHTARPEAIPADNGIARIRNVLGNGYRNRRFGAQLAPASKMGWILAKLVPPLHWMADVGFRFLPLIEGRPGRVLDIGCGAGEWLDLANGIGWQGSGIEPDPVARAEARKRGLDVRASAADFSLERNTFDYVTMSHVIEHVHDPRGLLHDAYDLLRAGGGLFVEAPNIEAWGHRIYGADWMPLDVPRHLVHFHRGSLSKAVSDAGFRNIRFHRRPEVFIQTFEQSRRIAAGLDPFDRSANPVQPRRAGPWQRMRSLIARRRSEYLTLTATKPVRE